jgi:Domain of unknown function (DUF4383)
MEAIAPSRQGRWTFAQWGIVVLASVQLLWSVAGLIAQPTFSTGADAPTTSVLGVDFNGIHALSGFVLFLPAYYFALKPTWALYYALYAAFALLASGIWAFLSTAPAWGLLTFPNNEGDAQFHVATGLLFAAVAALQIARDRRAAD